MVVGENIEYVTLLAHADRALEDTFFLLIHTPIPGNIRNAALFSRDSNPQCYSGVLEFTSEQAGWWDFTSFGTWKSMPEPDKLPDCARSWKGQAGFPGPPGGLVRFGGILVDPEDLIRFQACVWVCVCGYPHLGASLLKIMI